MVGEQLAELLKAAQQNRAAARKAAGRIMRRLRADDGIDSPWFSDQQVMTTLFQALLTGLPAGRAPGESAAPADKGLREVQDSFASHPAAMKWRLQHMQATPAGRAFLRMMPQLAQRMQANFSSDFLPQGIKHRSMSHLFAAAMSSTEGQQAVRQAAFLAQQAYTQRFWGKPMAFIPRIVIGSGPTGMAFAHSLLEAGDVGNTLVVSASEWAGGPFAWGDFQVNHRTRPVSPTLRAAPATAGTLDGFGPGMVAPNDLTGTWAYNGSGALAATAALHSLSAGPVVTAELVNWQENPLTGTVTVQLRHPGTGEVVFVETCDLVLAPGLGAPRELPGDALSLSVQDVLQHPDLHRIGDTVMVAGEADSSCIVAEELLNAWNRPGVSRGEHKLQQIVWVRPSGMVYKETFGLGERNRYAGRIADFLPRLTDPRYPSVIKVIPGRVTNTFRTNGATGVTITNNGSKTTLPFRDTIINTTGFQNPFADRWSSSTDGVFYTDDGFPVARQLGSSVTIVGPGAQLSISDIEYDLFPILREPALGRVNPVALFRNNLAAELLGRARAFVGPRRDSTVGRLRPRRSPGRTAGVEAEKFTLSLPAVDTSMVIKGDLESLVRLRLGNMVERIKDVPFDAIHLTITSQGGAPGLTCERSTRILNQVVLQPLFSDPEVQRMLAHQFLTRAQMASGLAFQLLQSASDTTMEIVVPVFEGRLVAEKLSIV